MRRVGSFILLDIDLLLQTGQEILAHKADLEQGLMTCTC